MRNRCDIYKIARQCGITLRDGHEHSQGSRKPYECFCKPTLRQIGRRDGEEHLKLVLMLLSGDSANARELYSDMVKATSAVLIGNPDLLKRTRLVDQFNAIDLASLRRASRDIACGVARTDKLKVLLTLMLYPRWTDNLMGSR